MCLSGDGSRVKASVIQSSCATKARKQLEVNTEDREGSPELFDVEPNSDDADDDNDLTDEPNSDSFDSVCSESSLDINLQMFPQIKKTVVKPKEMYETYTSTKRFVPNVAATTAVVTSHDKGKRMRVTVSYTHLTLPTKRIV